MHKNNFDFLRLVFSLLVVVSHSYPLTGSSAEDWLYQLTGGQMILSTLGVDGFFVISGYLIYQSLQRSKSYLDFFWKRILRLFPALIIVLLLTVVLIWGAYEGPGSYWSNKAVWTYFPRNISLYFPQYTIPGVFDHNPYPGAINGSLWTIAYEFTCYGLLSFLFFIPARYGRYVLAGAFLLFFLLWVVKGDQLDQYHFVLTGKNFVHLSLFFIGGALLASWNISKLGQKPWWLLLVLVLLVAILATRTYTLLQHLVLPAAIILFGLQSTPYINNLGARIGDLSYGIYIYAFPVQQALAHFFKPGLGPMMICSIALSALAGFISWHLVEKKCLKLKQLDSFTLVKRMTVKSGRRL